MIADPLPFAMDRRSVSLEQVAKQVNSLIVGASIVTQNEKAVATATGIEKCNPDCARLSRRQRCTAIITLPKGAIRDLDACDFQRGVTGVCESYRSMVAVVSILQVASEDKPPG